MNKIDTQMLKFEDQMDLFEKIINEKLELI
jgi:hypothetical protein